MTASPGMALGRRMASGLAVALALILAGCAALPPQPPASPAQIEALQRVTRFRLTGRIGAKYQGQGFYGNLRWRHAPDADDILILSPLGQGVARIVRDAAGVTLTTPEHRVYRAASAEELTREVLGWRLPLAGLRYWVLGRAAPGSPADVSPGPGNLPRRLIQDTWQIDYSGFETVAGLPLPRKLEMRRGDLEVKLAVDQWDIGGR